MCLISSLKINILIYTLSINSHDKTKWEHGQRLLLKSLMNGLRLNKMLLKRVPFYNQGPFYYVELTLIPAWISKHNPYKVWGENAYPFPNFNGAAVEVREWISNFNTRLIGHVITYPCWD